LGVGVIETELEAAGPAWCHGLTSMGGCRFFLAPASWGTCESARFAFSHGNRHLGVEERALAVRSMQEGSETTIFTISNKNYMIKPFGHLVILGPA